MYSVQPVYTVHFVEQRPGATQRRFSDILAQSHIKLIIEQAAKKDNTDRTAIESRALRILQGIADTQNHRDARTLASIVRTVFRQVYQQINVLPRGFLSHNILFKAGILGIENVGGDLDAVTGRRCTFAFFPWNWDRGDGW